MQIDRPVCDAFSPVKQRMKSTEVLDRDPKEISRNTKVALRPRPLFFPNDRPKHAIDPALIPNTASAVSKITAEFDPDQLEIET